MWVMLRFMELLKPKLEQKIMPCGQKEMNSKQSRLIISLVMKLINHFDLQEMCIQYNKIFSVVQKIYHLYKSFLVCS